MSELFHFEPHLRDPALTIALALAFGILGQAIGRHLRMPGIVVLLGFGVALGTDALGWIDTSLLGDNLQMLVGFAVAIVLFEGGLNLNLRDLRRQAVAIRRLVTIGALATTLGGALAARVFLGWPWAICLLFGTMVIVTGPTVINPLLRRIRVERKVATVLEAEGIFGDAVGALVAVVALEVVLAPSGVPLASAVASFAMRWGIGIALGAIFGLVMVLILRFEGAMPEGLENTFVLTAVLLLYQISNGLMEESGIVSTIVAGVIVGGAKIHALEDLREFKEQLTVLVIGVLFVLLAADVRISGVIALGWPGVLTVAALMFVVRPINVAVSTINAGLNLREKIFLSWLAPRGIVAAAVASLFALEMEANGLAGGRDLRALVFLVIGSTVLIQGLTGGLVARVLGLRPPPPSGWLIVGAEALGRTVARVLEGASKKVVLIDSNPSHRREAEQAGFRVVSGSALDDNVLRRARIEDRRGVVGLTTNEDVNFAFARTAHREHRRDEVWVAMRRGRRSVSTQMIERMGGRVLFGESRDLDAWNQLLGRSLAAVEVWRVGSEQVDAADLLVGEGEGAPHLAVAIVRRGEVLLFDSTQEIREGDELHLAVRRDAAERVGSWLRELGMTREVADSPPADETLAGAESVEEAAAVAVEEARVATEEAAVAAERATVVVEKAAVVAEEAAVLAEPAFSVTPEAEEVPAVAESLHEDEAAPSSPAQPGAQSLPGSGSPKA